MKERTVTRVRIGPTRHERRRSVDFREPPGNIVMWRGLARLNDITLGATMQIDVVGS